jgi:hypothetical protein
MVFLCFMEIGRNSLCFTHNASRFPKKFRRKRKKKGTFMQTLLCQKKWILLLGLVCPILEAQSLPETLEVQVWNAPPSELFRVEKQLVHALWQKPADTAFVYYLLSHIYLRMFGAEPTYTRGLQQALQLGQEAMELQPDSEYGYLSMAEMLFVLGKKQEASFLLHSLQAQAEKKHRPISWRLKFQLVRMQQPEAATLLPASKKRQARASALGDTTRLTAPGVSK